MKDFKWDYCPVCNTMTVICPKCGNNCCNGGIGTVDGEECDVCELAYNHMKHSEKPSKPDNWLVKRIKNEIEFINQFSEFNDKNIEHMINIIKESVNE